jgi:hypothetical protein
MRDSRGFENNGIEHAKASIHASLALVLTGALSMAAGTGCGIADPPADDIGDENAHTTLDWEAAGSGESQAHMAQLGVDLEEAVERADQILYGEVVEITYAISEDLGPDTLSFPHTFVTIRVDEPIKGGQPGDLVTLRFGGGPTGDGRILTGSDVPLFGVDDEVVAFVERNGLSACPLVECSGGLVRMSEGAAYDAHGTELFLDGEGELREGAVREIPEATEFEIDGQVMRLEREVRFERHPIADRAAPAAEFIRWLGAHVEEQVGPAELAALPSVASEDPAVPFVIEHPRPVAPRMAEATPNTMSDADRAELDALRANDNNPVLPR